ncbi:helix-turn-helix domain-containing protein [Oceanirhabdus sp. W0125-5]|uniref:helix-turn-helix domain-containing protein n=1 Tax=Oceanirhabdus sp. W0125-5 TaxID=2999116 RepID=UPI0022F2C332|nr:helix-turn-helix domain-containing protein [Oceanirhabdus sp. W0125-5]WBW95185.1 helix-turn-helix domain-containing protein [Oceanirhabdus sp. W0125-5]
MNNKNKVFFIITACIVIILFMGIRIYSLEVSIRDLSNKLSIATSSNHQIYNEVNSLNYKLNKLENILKEEIHSLKLEDEKAMSLTELSEYLDVSIQSLSGAIDSIPHVSFNGEKRFLKSEVDKWFKDSTTSGFSSFTKEVMNPGELSRYLNVSMKDIMAWVQDDNSDIPFSMNGSLYRFKKEDIDKWWHSRQ